MDGLPVDGVKLVMQQKLMLLIVILCKLVVRPVSNVAPRVGRHLFPLDKNAYGFKREHLPRLQFFNTVLCNTVFCRVVADAV